jgi:hypothetical protein
VNATSCTLQRTTATGNAGPVLRFRQWSSTSQHTTPASPATQRSGIAGIRTPVLSGVYGVTMNGRVAARAAGKYDFNAHEGRVAAVLAAAHDEAHDPARSWASLFYGAAST